MAVTTKEVVENFFKMYVQLWMTEWKSTERKYAGMMLNVVKCMSLTLDVVQLHVTTPVWLLK